MNDMKRYVFLCALWISFATSCWAGVTMKAEVDKKQLTTDEVVTYKCSVDLGAQEIEDFTPPSFNDFSVLSTFRSSHITFEKNTPKTTVIFVFVIAPLKTGTLSISPSVIKTKKGETVRSESFDLVVTEGRNKPSPRQEQQPATPQDPYPDSGQPQITL